MSRLRYADYSQAVAGRTIHQCLWVNEPDFRSLSLVFTDSTMVTFRFESLIEEEAEIADYRDGVMTNERTLTPIPVTRKNENPSTKR